MVASGSNHFPFYNQTYHPDSNNLVYLRPSVFKINAQCDTEWMDVYRWEEDDTLQEGDYYTHNFNIGDAFQITETSDTTYLVSGVRNIHDQALNVTIYHLMLYELDQKGAMLKDTVYYSTNHSFSMSRQLLIDDSTLLILNASEVDVTDLYGPSFIYFFI